MTIDIYVWVRQGRNTGHLWTSHSTSQTRESYFKSEEERVLFDIKKKALAFYQGGSAK